MNDVFDSIKNERLRRQLRFIAEIDALKRVLRHTLLLDGSRRENDAEHSWHIAVMAAILEEYAGEPFSMERVLKMALLHDLVEVYAGDTFAFDAAANEGKEAREAAAADRLFARLPKEQGAELRSLWEEFDAAQSADAKYAAALDRLQPFIHNLCTEGHTWVEGGATLAQVMARSGPVMDALPALRPWMQEQIEAAIEKGWIAKD